MLQEVREIPALAARLIAEQEHVADVAGRIRTFDPRFVVICGRGSSSNVGIYLRYLAEIRAGLLVSFSAPSVITAYHKALDMHGILFVVISQSGKSPDLVAATEQARRSGALTVAIVNDAASPVAMIADLVLAINAGPEHSVAATKTVALSMAQSALLVANMSMDTALKEDLARLPHRLEEALSCDWSAWGASLPTARAAFVIARGYQLASAKEIALKLLEILQLPALAYSTAEFRHGPVAAVARDTPVLELGPQDAASGAVNEIARELSSKRRPPAFATRGSGANLPWPGNAGSASDAISLLLPAYLALERAARMKGLNPDKPPGLIKVTQTY